MRKHINGEYIPFDIFAGRGTVNPDGSMSTLPDTPSPKTDGLWRF